MKKIEIAPSILSADFTNLAKEIQLLEQADIKRIHLDVMDGHFVPNITFGPPLVESIRKITDLFLETHLMIENPEKFIIPFRKAGSDMIVVHYETEKDKLPLTIEKIKDTGAKVGVSINPQTPWENLKGVLLSLDLVLVMTVNPGFGGQGFIEDVLSKIGDLHKYIKDNNMNCKIEVDGGINPLTARKAVQAGADVLVAGASVFKNKAGAISAIKELRQSIENI